MAGRQNPPRSIKPLVSFVIVTHGGGHLLATCLAAVAEHTRESYEVIVLDSASPDGTGEWARRALRDVTVHVNPRNLGFGALSNAGVLDSRAPYVCFLNADVTVERHWLPPLLEVLESQPSVGAVAPLILNPDRSVQECGSIVRADGWTAAWTGDELSGASTALFRRPVDYASAACLLVRRTAFHAVGGFAPEYHIAYFEDADLAFAMREAGWTTVVEPRSVVVHERHGMSGSERATQLMRYNHGTFAGKWARQLDERLPPPNGQSRPHRLAHARDLTATERVLVIDDRVPNADRGSGDPRTQQLVEALLARDRMITFLARDGSRATGYARWLAERGVEVVWDVPDLVEWMSHRMGCFDVVIVSRPHNWEWAARAVDMFQPQAMRVYDAEALFHRRLDQLAAALPDDHLRQEAKQVREIEAKAFGWADVGMCITQEELEWVVDEVMPNTTLHLVGYSAPVVSPVPGFRDRTGIAFFGGFMAGPGSPNEQSVLELVSEVWPTLLVRHPDLTLSIVGSDPTRAVYGLAGPAIKVVGRVPDPAWWLGRARLHLAPMRFGAGLKLKFVESMAAGLPFLTTPLGAEGLRLGPLVEHLVSESPAEMAEQANRLLSDSALWTDVQVQLLDGVREHFSTAAFQRSVDEVLLSCGLAPARR